MAIYFSNTLSKEPFQFDSVGNHWLQEALSRPQGYPIYHYLQTEEGCGIFTIDGKEYFLPEDHGILITPHVPHAYRAADTSAWITCFATFGGTMEALALVVATMTANSTCAWLAYQPEEPEEVKMLKKD